MSRVCARHRHDRIKAGGCRHAFGGHRRRAWVAATLDRPRYLGAGPATGTSAMNDLSPARIAEVGMGFWPAKTLLSAVELGVFTRLGPGAQTGDELQAAL